MSAAGARACRGELQFAFICVTQSSQKAARFHRRSSGVKKSGRGTSITKLALPGGHIHRLKFITLPLIEKECKLRRIFNQLLFVSLTL